MLNVAKAAIKDIIHAAILTWEFYNAIFLIIGTLQYSFHYMFPNQYILTYFSQITYREKDLIANVKSLKAAK